MMPIPDLGGEVGRGMVQQPSALKRFFPALPVLLLLGLYTAAIHTPSALGIPLLLTMAAVTLIAPLLGSVPGFHVGLMGTMNLACILVPPLAAAWPLSGAVAVGIYVGIVSSARRLRRSAGWEGWNPPRGSNLVWTGVVGLVGCFLIMGWVWVARPDLSGQMASIPQASLFALVLSGLLFALLNSFAEEAVFRGVFLPALNATLGSREMALVLQAAVFGLMHVGGLPSGPSGMVIAGVMGLAFGELRLRTGGILAPWLAHAVVNLFMILFLATLAGGTTP
jgi:membrane protease YdiL (CAAX protease family)